MKVSRLMVVLLAWIMVASSGLGWAEEMEKPNMAVEMKVAAKNPEVWMCVHHPFDLVAPGGDWDFVRENLSGFKMYIGDLWKAPEETLKVFVGMLKENGIKFAIECGGVNIPSTLRVMDRIHAAGGKVDFLDMDHPMRRTMEQGQKKGVTVSPEEAADKLVAYMQGVRKKYPETGFWLLSNFPNWGYRGDVSYHARGANRQDWGEYDDVLRAALKKTKEAGIPLEGLTVDNPYEYVTGIRESNKLDDPSKIDWMKRLRTLEDFVRDAGLNFNLIIISEDGGKMSEHMFYERCMALVDIYNKAGGAPERLMVQSWYKHPVNTIPETAPHTMTNLVKDIILKTRQ
ncbi:hypothetical protein ACFL1X_10145 [Candidatus Hydrogenedentota bacterium]